MTPANELAIQTEQRKIADWYSEFAPELRGFLTNRLGDPESAEDVVQLTFVKLAQHSQQVHPQTIRAWLYRVAINESNQIGRRKKIEDKAKKQLVNEFSEFSVSTETTAIQRESIERTRELLEALPPKYRMVVRLKFYEGMTFAQIADKLDRPLGTVLSQMRTALEKMKHSFRE